MNILYLTGKKNAYSNFSMFLTDDGNCVTEISGKFDIALLDMLKTDFIISHNYRYIIPFEITHRMEERIINLHISMLPWNRGADPNFWSWAERTPKGVTIHRIDEGIDTGEILAQKEIEFKEKDLWGETFLSTYVKLQDEMEKLFLTKWDEIKNGRIKEQRQVGLGSFHFSSEKLKYKDCMPNGWLTTIEDFLVNINNAGRR
jgi:methionyl-tRNA formyltransferase